MQRTEALINLVEVIAIRKLVKDYGNLRAVDGIDLSIQKGEVYAFLGPNGAGKTTTVEILEGLRPRTSGEVEVLGLDPWKDNKKLIRQLGVIPQDFKFFDKITPKEAVAFYAGLFGKRADADAILKKVRLEDKASDRYETLSGGQKQKMGLALALVNEPAVLFLDEPTTGLDPQARRSIWEVIRSLRSEGRTVFLTTHYLEEAQLLADRVAIINHGKIVATGSPEDIIREHGRSEVLSLQAPPKLADYLRSKLDLPVRAEDHTVDVELNSNEDVLRVLTLVQQSGIPWTGVSTRQDTLEDVFIRLVGKTTESGDVGPAALGGAK